MRAVTCFPERKFKLCKQWRKPGPGPAGCQNSEKSAINQEIFMTGLEVMKNSEKSVINHEIFTFKGFPNLSPLHHGWMCPKWQPNGCLLPFWGLLLPFWETPEILEETWVRHLRGVYWDHVHTKSKEIGPVVEGQEEQQFCDGTDGPSNQNALMLLFPLPQTSQMVDSNGGYMYSRP